MTEELEKIVSRHEMQRLELKEGFNVESIEAACAFANAGGGFIVIEHYGRGIKRIKEECDRNGNPYPDWIDRPGEFLTIYKARGSQDAEVGGKEREVGSNVREVGSNGIEDGAKGGEVGSKIDFVAVMPNVRKDFRVTCRRVWELLCQDDTLLQQEVSERLEIALNSIQNAYAALKDAGLLVKTGEGRGSKWTVVRGKFPQA